MACTLLKDLSARMSARSAHSCLCQQHSNVQTSAGKHPPHADLRQHAGCSSYTEQQAARWCNRTCQLRESCELCTWLQAQLQLFQCWAAAGNTLNVCGVHVRKPRRPLLTNVLTSFHSESQANELVQLHTFTQSESPDACSARQERKCREGSCAH